MNEELDLGKLFVKFVNFNRRNKKLLIIFILIGVLTVILYQNFKKPYYETNAICMSGIAEYERQDQVEDLSQRTAIDLINHLQISIDNEDYSYISNALGVELNVASSIKKIEAEQLYQQDMDEKFYALNKFEIRLVIFDNQLLSQISDGLIYYFENNDFVSNYYNRYLESNIKIIKDIENEISLLGEVRMAGAKNNLDISSVNIISGKEGKELSNQIVSLSHLREEININQDLLLPLVYVQRFPNVEHKEDDILLSSVLGAFISLIFGMFIALIKEAK